MVFNKFFLINFFIFILFFLDRFFKYYFFLNPDKRWDFIFSLHLSKNIGIAFSLPAPLPVIIISTFGIIFILISFYIKSSKSADHFNSAALALIICGAFSNLFDRIKYGFVIDYFDVPYFTVLNLADIMISCGALMLIISEFFFHAKLKNKSN